MGRDSDPDSDSDSDSDWAPEKEIEYSGNLEDARQQWAESQMDGLQSIVNRWRHHLGGAPDIIDLETERIVTNNGHLKSLPVDRSDLFRGYGGLRKGEQESDDDELDDGDDFGVGTVASVATDPLAAITLNRCELLTWAVEQLK